MSITVVLPLPPSDLSPNRASHSHWTKRHKATKVYRRTAWANFVEARPSAWTPGRVEVAMDYYCSQIAKGYRPRDAQNAMSAIKAAIDGMVDAGMCPNDSAKWLSWGRIRLYTTAEESRKYPDGAVVLTVTRL